MLYAAGCSEKAMFLRSVCCVLMGTLANTEDVGPIQETAEENKTQHNTKRNIQYQFMKKDKIMSEN